MNEYMNAEKARTKKKNWDPCLCFLYSLFSSLSLSLCVCVCVCVCVCAGAHACWGDPNQAVAIILDENSNRVEPES